MPTEIEKEKEPINFYPTLETLLHPKDWKLFLFSPEEEKEVLKKHGLAQLPSHEVVKERESTIDEKHEENFIFSSVLKRKEEKKTEKEIPREIFQKHTTDILKDRKHESSQFWKRAIEEGLNKKDLIQIEKKKPVSPPIPELVEEKVSHPAREKRITKPPDRLTFVFKVPTPETLPPRTLGEAKKNEFWKSTKTRSTKK